MYHKWSKNLGGKIMGYLKKLRRNTEHGGVKGLEFKPKIYPPWSREEGSAFDSREKQY